ncbi:MAG: hypothetical protein JXQ85_14430 [Cognatishimia sp.]|uniref:hypothetical protein n=1 Tax=Cognatishimia sp. TaxID=2211648 RepID=UPI003B8D659C
MSESHIKRDLKKIGLQATLIYSILLIGGIPFGWYFEFLVLKPISINELGDFLAGAFGPLALFWLILSFFQQSKELQNSVDALNLQARELQRTVEQQTKLTEITEAQHQLDVAAREEETQMRLDRETPNISISSRGASGGKEITNQFAAKNKGGDANRVLITTTPKIKRTSPSVLHRLDSKADSNFNLITETAMSKTPGLNLIVISEGANGMSRIQEFDISKPGWPEINNRIFKTGEAESTVD